MQTDKHWKTVKTIGLGSQDEFCGPMCQVKKYGGKILGAIGGILLNGVDPQLKEALSTRLEEQLLNSSVVLYKNENKRLVANKFVENTEQTLSLQEKIGV